MTSDYSKYEAQLAEALAQPVGIAVLCHSESAADNFRRLMYVARAKARERGVTDYDALSFAFAPSNGAIVFIYKRDSPPENGEAKISDLTLLAEEDL